MNRLNFSPLRTAALAICPVAVSTVAQAQFGSPAVQYNPSQTVLQGITPTTLSYPLTITSPTTVSGSTTITLVASMLSVPAGVTDAQALALDLFFARNADLYLSQPSSNGHRLGRRRHGLRRRLCLPDQHDRMALRQFRPGSHDQCQHDPSGLDPRRTADHPEPGGRDDLHGSGGSHKLHHSDHLFGQCSDRNRPALPSHHDDDRFREWHPGLDLGHAGSARDGDRGRLSQLCGHRRRQLHDYGNGGQYSRNRPGDARRHGGFPGSADGHPADHHGHQSPEQPDLQLHAGFIHARQRAGWLHCGQPLQSQQRAGDRCLSHAS